MYIKISSTIFQEERENFFPKEEKIILDYFSQRQAKQQAITEKNVCAKENQ